MAKASRLREWNVRSYHYLGLRSKTLTYFIAITRILLPFLIYKVKYGAVILDVTD